MSFQPVVPFSGTAGYAFLQRTRESQQAAFEQAPLIKRNVEAFRDRIASITSAEELVADRQLLEVALGAFGLDEDINNKYFIEKILSSDTEDPKSLASKFSDKRYSAMAKAFGFGDANGPSLDVAGFADRITDAYQDRQFEIAVGESDSNMRLAMSFERELATINDQTELSDNARWYSVMASPPLRKVFETALGLPQSFGTLDLDRQLTEFRDRAERVFGTSDVTDFADPDMQKEALRLFLVRGQIADGQSQMGSGASIALTLLQGG
ncbi:uncharacterized protein DUF1217 [Palleronia aestuarii]|uniref:Uncharacterized protein DUF1217 n=1 Tax=Palleronia aestuarii TaxID=568105 RepID=A0A2W7N4T4_9RHOB|nr:DUF1217 domain-containing protein [Palleronia aestuarii]PZX15068.1 uncharacterized protein DUF1217 [Palleronia aestuarii]